MAHPKWLFTAICLLLAAAVAVAAGGDDPKTFAPGEPRIKDREIGSSPRMYNGGQSSYPQSQYPEYHKPGKHNYQSTYPNPQYPQYMAYPPQYPGQYQQYTTDYLNSSYYPQNNHQQFPPQPPIPHYPLPIAGTRNTPDPCGVVHPICSCPNSPYRTFDGTCNNVEFGNRGSINAPLNRVLKPRYADGISAVITRTEFGRLPLPRVVSSTIFEDRNRPDRINALSVMQWGQLVSHDVSLIRNRQKDGKDLKCCTPDGQMLPPGKLDPNCLPIEIPPDDPFYSKFYLRCMEMVRSRIQPQMGCPAGAPIQQISVVTQFLDASFLYGSSDEENRRLRTFRRGLMRTKQLEGGYGGRQRSFLPNVEKPTDVCDVKSDDDVCYLAGDVRVSQNPFLAALHTIFLREHNRLAKALHKLNPYWSDDTLFQESRRIVIAQWQHITYEYWLPRLVGNRILNRLNIQVHERNFSDLYDKKINPCTMNEFTTSAFRFFHSTVQGFLDLDPEGRCPFGSLRLSDYFFKPGVLEKDDIFDSVLRGSVTQPNQAADRFFTNELTKFLFRSSKPFGDDLESFDVQRVRDHGIPSYNDMRVVCGFRRADDFDDLRDVMTRKNINFLKNLYPSVNDVDFFVGGTLEETGVDGDDTATVGPTFGCVIAEQFLRWQRGDRYFFDLGGQAGSFTLAQLIAIDTANFSSILCDNLDYLKFVQFDAFLLLGEGNQLLNCNEIDRLDLRPWKGFNPAPPACYHPLKP